MHPRTLFGMAKNLKQQALNVCEMEEQEEELMNLEGTFQMNG